MMHTINLSTVFLALGTRARTRRGCFAHAQDQGGGRQPSTRRAHHGHGSHQAHGVCGNLGSSTRASDGGNVIACAASVCVMA